MSRIRIKNFGPIKEGCTENDGWIDISKVTVFTGNQGSGKSTVAKLISTFTWIEKALVRGDYDQKWFEKPNRMFTDFFPYHRLENYIEHSSVMSGKSTIDYHGNAYIIRFERNRLAISKVPDSPYPLPQIMYVPAERNFLSNIGITKDLKLFSDSLQEFNTEYSNAKDSLILSPVVKLPINKASLIYDFQNRAIRLRGEDGFEIGLSEASSGFQSLVPVFLVTKNLAESVEYRTKHGEKMSPDEESRFRKEFEEIVSNKDLTSEQRRLAVSVLSSKFTKSAFVNIVEEPEQNLYPSSQWELLKSLLEFNNLNEGNKLSITTHSPYIVNYLSIAIQAYLTRQKLNIENLIERLNSIVPEKSQTAPNDVSIYEMDEKTGTIKRLPTYEGIPSDNNILNESLAQGNELFDQILEIEQEIESR